MPRKKKGKATSEVVEKVEDTYKDKGVKAFASEKFDDAVAFFTQAIAQNGQNHAIYSNRSATYMAMKDFQKALADAEKVIELKPDWPKGFFRKGAALENLLRYPEAFVAYQEGLARDANDENLKKAAMDLAALLEELKITERELDQAGNPDADVFSAMVQWLKDGGALFPKLYLQYYSEDYRGVHCLTKVPADDVVLYVPFKYIMTSELAKASDVGKKILASKVDLRSKHSYLASYLLQEKHKQQSHWDPYLNVLPEHYANMPIFFDEEIMSHLQGSFCLGKIADRIDSLRREYDNIRRAVPEFVKFSHEEFVWARLVVITRIFGLLINGHKTDGLVPFADMLNHKRPRETKWTFDDGRYGFVITSLKTIQRGEQIFDSYGRKCNSRFFVNYGFALDENADNEAVLRVTLPPSDAHYNMKIRFLGGRESYARREFQVPGNYREKKCKELFSFLRFLHAKDSELMLLSSTDGFKLDAIGPVSARNEIAALAHLKRAASEALARFPQTYAQDLATLKSGALAMYGNHRNCVVQRTGEKAVLAWFVSVAEMATTYLKMPWKDLKKVVAKAQQGATGFDYYLTSVVGPLVRKAA